MADKAFVLTTEMLLYCVFPFLASISEYFYVLQAKNLNEEWKSFSWYDI